MNAIQKSHEMAYQVAKEAFASMCSTGLARHYLYVVPSTETDYGRLVAVPDEESAPEGADLVTGETMPRNMTVDQLSAWIKRFTGSLPLLPYGVEEPNAN